MFLQRLYRLSLKQRVGACVLLGAVVSVLAINAWVAEDAYISFRVIDNAVHGYGLRWNVNERVQVYTHPLWLLLLLGAYAITKEVYITSIVVSLVLATLGLIIGAFGIARSFPALVFLLAAAALAAPFVDFATAGLESPLAYVLVALFFWLMLRPRVEIFPVSFIASLLMLTRHDFLLLVMPALLWVLWRHRSWRALGLAVLGMLPFVFWEGFALIYYGFAFPNTAYAKLNAAISHWEYLKQGFRYIADVIVSHPLVTGVFLVGVMVVRANNRRAGRMLMIGVLLYLAYIIWIGGDFMTGRFVAVPFWAALLVCARYWPKDIKMQYMLFAGLVILGGVSARPIWYLVEKHTYAEESYRFNGVADEKSFYFPFTGLVNDGRNTLKVHYWIADALHDLEQGKSVVVRRNVGLYGYFVGPSMYVIDIHALTNPLLSRTRDLDTSARERTTATDWRIGHFTRKIPEGYVESVESGQNVIQDPAIAQLYDDLEVITQGPIWNMDRFRKIFEYAL